MLAYYLMGMMVILHLTVVTLASLRSSEYRAGDYRESDRYDDFHYPIIMLGLMEIIAVIILLWGLATHNPVFYFEWY